MLFRFLLSKYNFTNAEGRLIKFLNDKGLKDQTGIELKEGYYWYDKSIIKAYDTNGNIHKVVRLKVNNDLSISFKRYKDKEFEIESNDTNLVIEVANDKIVDVPDTLSNMSKLLIILAITGILTGAILIYKSKFSEVK